MSEQFENSIRKKLQDAEIPFDPAAWDQMKKRLDDSDRRRPVLFWWILSGLLILTAAGGTLWWIANDHEKNNPLREMERVAVTVSEQPAAPAEEETPSVNNQPGDHQPASANNNDRVNSSVDKSSTGKQIFSGKTTSAVNNIPGNVEQSANRTSGRTPSSGKNTSVVNNTVGKSEQPANGTSGKTQSSVGKDEQSINEKTTPTVDNTSGKVESPANETSTNTLPQKPAIATNVDTTQKQQLSTNDNKDSVKQKRPQRKGLEAGITLGPDYNIAASMKRGKIGFNLGVIVKYNFSNAWSIQSGAIYNKKLYGANASEYTFNYPNTYKWVAADCDVLDVPLNVNYTFAIADKTRWSAMLGASSYFMLKEKYDYWWANGTKTQHEFKNENKHYFSVVNIGVNWEHQTEGRLRWSLQPYVKVPLGGVGQGKVKLYTVGAAVQLTLGKK